MVILEGVSLLCFQLFFILRLQTVGDGHIAHIQRIERINPLDSALPLAMSSRPRNLTTVANSSACKESELMISSNNLNLSETCSNGTPSML